MYQCTTFFFRKCWKRIFFFCKQTITETFVELKMSFEMKNHTAWWHTQHYSRWFFSNWNGRNGMLIYREKLLFNRCSVYFQMSQCTAKHLNCNHTNVICISTLSPIMVYFNFTDGLHKRLREKKKKRSNNAFPFQLTHTIAVLFS